MAGGGRKSKVYVVGAEYCDSKPVKLATTQNVAVKQVESPNINVSDREKNTVLFEVNDTSSEHGIHKKYALLDNRYDKIILSLQDKIGNDTVEVYPGVDRAFIVSLWIILYGTNQRQVQKRDAAKAIFQVISAVGVVVAFV